MFANVSKAASAERHFRTGSSRCARVARSSERAARSARRVPEAVASAITTELGSGGALPRSVAASMAPAFGTDFSSVRIHADPRAAHFARSLEARAFTLGRDVFFGAGEYRPESSEGRRLLAHELTHVVQQRASPVDPRWLEPEGSGAEREAERAARAVGAGRASEPVTAAPLGIARDVGWAGRGEIPDPYGMGYNEIYRRAGTGSKDAVLDLTSLETASMDVSITTFEGLSLARRNALLALEPHASGTACEPWFAKLRASPKHRADALAGTMSGMQGELYWGGNSGSNPGDSYRIKTTTSRPTDAAAPDVAKKVAGQPATIATETNTNDFALWMRGGAVPTNSSKMNCWEAIFFAAYQAGLVSDAQLKKLHSDAASAGVAASAKSAYDAAIAKSLGFGASKPLGGLHPGRGDIVFFNGTDHVALSLGSLTATGEHEVVSLWVLPPDPATKEFVSSIQRTTIEELSRNMVTYIGSAPSIRFAPNPF